MLREFSANSILATHEEDAQLILACSLYRTQHNFGRGIITAHRIESNTNGGRCRTHACFPSGSPIVLSINGRRVEVVRGFDGETLAQLVTVLERL